MEQLGEMFNRQKMALISKWGSTFIAYYDTLSGMISLKSKFPGLQKYTINTSKWSRVMIK